MGIVLESFGQLVGAGKIPTGIQDNRVWQFVLRHLSIEETYL